MRIHAASSQAGNFLVYGRAIYQLVHDITGAVCREPDMASDSAGILWVYECP